MAYRHERVTNAGATCIFGNGDAHPFAQAE